MKRVIKFVIVAVIAMFSVESVASAQILKNLFKKSTATETTTAASTSGQKAGAALKALYTQYKADGKVDMSNLTTITNVATLATNIKGLKGQSDKSAFYKDFAKGLVLGSNNLVTSSTSSSVMSGLSSLVNNVDLSSLTEAATSSIASTLTNASAKADTAVENASEIATSVTNILNLFK